MVRTQIQLTEKQAEALHRIARQRRVSVAHLVREGVDRVLAQPQPVDREELVRRALSVVGKFHSGLTDVARNHDDYFVEAILHHGE